LSGELRLVRDVLVWGTLAMLVAAGLLFGVRGGPGALSVILAGGLVIANALVSALISTAAGRLSPTGAMMISLPSFAVRLSLIAGAMTFLKGRSFIDEPVFAAAFAVTILAVIVFEARAFKRTPWLVLTFDTEGS
jgi:hypothetical protein